MQATLDLAGTLPCLTGDEPVNEHTFDTGAVSINYVAEGREDGPPIVFLHGVTGRWQTWLPVMTAFAAGWRLYALDFRGHGRSGRAPGAYRAVDYAADVIAFLRRRVEQPAVLIGHSLGAIVAIAVAADAPEAVRAAVLEDPPLGVFDEQDFAVRPERPGFRASHNLAAAGLPRERLFAALAAREPGVDAAALGARTLALSQLDPDVLTTVLENRAREGYGLAARLKRIACPVLLQQGNVALGAAVDDARVAEARSLLADCTFEHFPDVGHGIHGGQPFAFCRSVRAFLGTLP
jgi:pimeloyl-ACP methyl ester carboxylesterase